MKILLLGSTGVLGAVLCENLKLKNYDVYACGLKQKTKYNFNILQNNKLKKIIHKIQPKIIINCIVNRNIDNCNKNFFYGYDLNVRACEIITKAIFQKNIHLIHLSTDQVYSNKIKKNKIENFEQPVNFYGLTKLIGEKIISSHRYHTILRTNFFNLNLRKEIGQAEWIYNKLNSDQKIFVPYNVIFNPIPTEELSKIIIDIIKKKIYGLYDIGSKKNISKFEFANYIVQKYKLKKNLVKKYKNLQEFTNRPNNTCLNNRKIENKLKYKIKFTF